MFGLMRFGCGAKEPELERRWRMHYCGTCKTIGSRYGQRARLFLNHDAAFLAELLDWMTGADAEQWSEAYRSWNCMSLPDDEEMPLLLRYTAAVNVLLGEYKVRDHEADSRRAWWTWLRRWFSPAFRKAQSDLVALEFPVEEVERILSRQAELEATAGVRMEDVAAPTAEVTALVFRHGARLAKLDAMADVLAGVGYRFGELIYILDAYEDFDRDARTGAFNAVRSTGTGRDQAAARIREDEAEIAAALPREFRLRLRGNIDAALGSQLPILRSCSRHRPETWGARWRAAVARTRAWKAPLLAFAAVVAMAFLFPRQARLAKSARECLSLGLNLMAVGGVVAIVCPLRDHPCCSKKSCCCKCCRDCECCCEGCEGCECCCGECCGEGCCSSCECGSCDC
jgi:hypothetical protein